MGYDRATRNRLRTIVKTMTVAPPKKDDAAAIKKALKGDRKKKKRRKVDDELEDKTSEAGEEDSKEKLDELDP
ncbi:MAG: hypothetical protein OXM01_17860 [Gemmatimonadota bacterium]|nr:hypothetical protein [Gemmatimonadota bacterium]